MLPGILLLLETKLWMDNPFVAFLLSITSGKSEGLLQVVSGLIALGIWSFFLLSLTYYRYTLSRGNTVNEFLEKEWASIALKMLFGTTAIFLFFGTSMLFDDLLLPLLNFFSDNESENAGLKFIFRYDTESVMYQWYYALMLLILIYTFMRTAYYWVMYHVIYKWERIQIGPDGAESESNFRKRFKVHGILFWVILLTWFSTLPEWAINGWISLVSDRTVRDIMLGLNTGE